MGSNKLIVGVNDLQSQFPDIAAEAYGWDPETLTAGSGKRQDWKCKEGHIYSSTVNNRTNGKGCPFCAGRKVLKGFNDLQSHYPDIAAEAYGWDPVTVTTRSNQKKDWKCSKGHTYSSVVDARTSRGNGCPFCSGQQVLAGFNDLKTKFPDIAAEAYGWDPVTVFSASTEKRGWKCNNEHIYFTTIRLRTLRKTGCPFCSGNKVLTGFNDLKTKFPDIAAEAFGWNPTTVVTGTHQKKDWSCSKGHIYSSSVNKRTGKGTGCPYCSGNKVLTGFNDLKTKFLDIASEAYGWDPSTLTAGADQEKKWKCNKGHIYSALIRGRTDQNSGCPFCLNQKVLAGFNDLKTKFPDIASEAFGWDPSTLVGGTHQKRDWECNKGHVYSAAVGDRTGRGTGCPICAEYGFNPEKDAWFYLMERPGEQQLGISNVITDRLRTHESNGWSLIEHTSVPSKGQKVLETENAFKKWLKKEIGVMEGTTENWSTTKMEVQSLAELKARSGIETDLF